MSKDRAAGRLPIFFSLVVALMLAIAPLPDWALPYRPDWIVIVLVYWAMQTPRLYSVGAAWVLGIILDVAHGTLLGQHALALILVIYITVKFHLQLRVFPASQMTAVVFALLALYQFVLFWINGVAGVHAEAVTYWGPVVVGAIFWPLVSGFLGGMSYRLRS